MISGEISGISGEGYLGISGEISGEYLGISGNTDEYLKYLGTPYIFQRQTVTYDTRILGKTRNGMKIRSSSCPQ
jgi:hypothetical protein